MRHPKYPTLHGSTPLGKVALERRVSLTVLLPEVEALQLLRLAKHLNRNVAELVLDAIKDMLAAVPREGNT